MDEIRKIPPVTRFLCASSLSVSVSSMMHLVSPYKIVFVKELVMRKWEVRLCFYKKWWLRMQEVGCEGIWTLTKFVWRCRRHGELGRLSGIMMRIVRHCNWPTRDARERAKEQEPSSGRCGRRSREEREPSRRVLIYASPRTMTRKGTSAAKPEPSNNEAASCHARRANTRPARPTSHKRKRMSASRWAANLQLNFDHDGPFVRLVTVSSF